jgi:predicted N-acyltransferase
MTQARIEFAACFYNPIHDWGEKMLVQKREKGKGGEGRMRGGYWFQTKLHN